VAEKRVAILCVNPWEQPGSWQPFSYAAYRIQAALADHAGVSDVRVFEAFRWSADRLVEELEAYDPDVIGGSAYVWSLSLFGEVLGRLKRARPDRLTILGGPSARVEMFALEPYRSAMDGVDCLVLGEGEEIIRELVRTPASLHDVAGLAVSTSSGWKRTASRAPIACLDDVPSPYQRGLVPSGVTAHLETFRGCPMSCMFCQWGAAGNRGSFYSIDYLVRELEAFRSSGTRGVYHVDAGLNLHSKAFKNLMEADRQVGLLRGIDFACEVYPTYLTDEHVAFLEPLNAVVGIGLQTYNQAVLDSIERPFDPRKLEANVAKLAPVCDLTAELILGLPGDDPISFRQTLRRALELPCSVRVHLCLVLPDALLTRAPASFEMRFDPITLQMISCRGWPEDELRRCMDELERECALRGGTFVRQPYGSARASEYNGEDYAGSSSTYWFIPGAVRPDARRKDAPSADGRLDPVASERTVPVVHLPILAEPEPPRDPYGVEPLIARLTRGSWQLEKTVVERGSIALHLMTSRGALELRAEHASPNARSYRTVRQVAFSYRGMTDTGVGAGGLSVLDALVEHLAPRLADQL
jgi:hypothetical protein